MEFKVRPIEEKETGLPSQTEAKLEDIDFAIGFNKGFGLITIDGEPVLVKQGERLHVSCSASDLEKIKIHRQGSASSPAAFVDFQEALESSEDGGDRQESSAAEGRGGHFDQGISRKENASKEVFQQAGDLKEGEDRAGSEKSGDREGRPNKFSYRDYSDGELKSQLHEARAGQPMVSFSDYLYALMLCIQSLRFSDKLFPGLAKEVPLALLDYAVTRVSRLYIPWLIYLVGLSLSLKFGFSNFGSTGALASILIWSLLAGLLIAPLLYAFVAPRPMKDYFIKVDDMTCEEREEWKKEKSRNPRMERLKKRYGKMGHFHDEDC